MILGTVLLIGAILALVLAIGAGLVDVVRRGDPKKRDLSIGAGWGAFALTGAALVMLAGSFLNADVSLQYVWQNVNTEYDWFERLSGLWVGRAGSLLMWTTFIIAFWSLEELRHRHAMKQSDEAAAGTAFSAHHTPRLDDVDQALVDTETVRRVARLAVHLVALLFLIVVLYGKPFAAVDAISLEQSPQGRGINPQLLIFYNAIHPPIVFLGYAATLIPTAFAASHLMTGRPGWIGSARRWAHIAFFTLTIGVTLGALWAYIALGWGGYWDWDPVEVASLVPWILTVAFLHAAYRHDGKGMFPIAAPFIAILLFAGSLLSTLIVRSGVWVSLHSFIAEGDAQDAFARYQSALDHPEVLLFSILVATLVALACILASVQAARMDAGSIETPKRRRPKARDGAGWFERSLRHLDLHNLFLVGVLMLVLLATVTITLLFVGINGFPSSRIREDVFTNRTGPVALTAITIMAVAISIGTLPRRTTLALLGGAVLLGAVAALLLPDLWALALAVPILAFAATMAGVRIVTAWTRMPKRRAVRFAAIHLIHLGVAVMLLGHGLVTAFETTEDTVELRVGETRTAGPYELTLLDLQAEEGDTPGRVHHVMATFLVSDADGSRRTVTAGFQYFEFQSHYKPDVGVARSLGADVYVSPRGIHDPSQGWIFGNLPLPEQGAREARSIDAINIEVSTLPLINLVWAGASAMILGGATLTFTSWTGGTPRPEPKTGPTTTPAHRKETPQQAAASLHTRPAHNIEPLQDPPKPP